MISASIIKEMFPKSAGLWTLDGTPSGLVDQSGNGNTLTPLLVDILPKIQTESGQSGYLLKDATTNRRLTAVDSTTLRPAELTVIQWFRPEAFTGSPQAIFIKMRNATASYSYLLQMLNTGIVQSSVFDSSARTAVSTSALKLTASYCLVCTASPSQQLVRVGINGVFEGSAAMDGNPITYDAFPLRNGCFTSGAQRTVGILGQCAILPYAITSQQFADYYLAETEPRRKHFLFGAAGGAAAQAANEWVRGAA